MNKQRFFTLVAMVAAMCFFLAGCAGKTNYSRQEENFKWPNDAGWTQIAARGGSNNYGSQETGSIRECPIGEGKIKTLKNVTEVEEDMPIYKDQLKCKNFEKMVKKVRKTTFTHEYVIEGKTVFTWQSEHENWWAMLPAYILSRFLDRGIDVAAAVATNGLSEAGDVIITAEGGDGGKAKSTSEVGNVEANSRSQSKTGKINLSQQQEQQLQPPTSKKKGGKVCEKGGKKK